MKSTRELFAENTDKIDQICEMKYDYKKKIISPIEHIIETLEDDIHQSQMKLSRYKGQLEKKMNSYNELERTHQTLIDERKTLMTKFKDEDET